MCHSLKNLSINNIPNEQVCGDGGKKNTSLDYMKKNQKRTRGTKRERIPGKPWETQKEAHLHLGDTG